MDRISKVFSGKDKILNVYITAGYPGLNDTVTIVKELEKNGVDMIELGMPFSDPLADGPTIQNSSEIAIQNGITLDIILAQVREVRETVEIPIVLMGYFNQLLQYGVSQFLIDAKNSGVDGMIIPDLPLEVYKEQYQNLFEAHDMKISFLITPQTNEDRINEVAESSTAFLYVVSSYAVTGGGGTHSDAQLNYFNRIKNLELNTPTLIGFGINDKLTFDTACQFANGAIIGSAFIKAIGQSEDLVGKISEFTKNVLKN
jgi:tryptophan synthase alpha chain